MKVIIGMSGGVDSSVSAALLKQQDYQVEGMFMKNWEEDDTAEICTADEDVKDAQAVSDRLGIKLHRRNFASEYWDHVFEEFLTEYKQGRTPNPDILCNREIKFKTFLDHADDIGATMMATGHYVRKGESGGEYQLLKGIDNNKDQSYFLYAINQYQLSRSLFPVGEIEKPEVRKIAESLGLNVFDKKDSTGICFIGEKRFQDFLSTYIKPNPGEIITPEGVVVGTHNGLMYYTIGQRQGLGIGGVKNALAEPWFVIAKSHSNNQLIVGQSNHAELMLDDTLLAKQVTWISEQQPNFPFKCNAKIRYRQADQTCEVHLLDEQTLKVKFDQAQKAITPGQSVVFYQGDVCLGGAIIESSNLLTSTCELKSA
ncbi:tRNA 2-thiouridine(34) synthase MnmA [Marinicella sp. S1101]|uniref:tRNA 2-thiouridine(34) synthase MnmA n=1 Tax=Marinicella marina TaxID=2996016 RepID=UPI0022608840|nr:tRNA 2-thiouridine(34) synthase MnmA [Marinicella marina]MCX7553518.1 tRNA 2-thiouridine(34) synthase MnmA [Marinicella marina]MDJ1140142.1 tRNA 2-thiouridine(34) synthase MnmA [Marinicella marina]